MEDGGDDVEIAGILRGDRTEEQCVSLYDDHHWRERDQSYRLITIISIAITIIIINGGSHLHLYIVSQTESLTHTHTHTQLHRPCTPLSVTCMARNGASNRVLPLLSLLMVIGVASQQW